MKERIELNAVSTLTERERLLTGFKKATMVKTGLKSLFADAPDKKNKPAKWLGRSAAPWVLSNLSAEDLQQLCLDDTDSSTSSPIKAEYPISAIQKDTDSSPVERDTNSSPVDESANEGPTVRRSFSWRRRTLLTESTKPCSKTEDDSQAPITDANAREAKDKPMISWENLSDPADDLVKAVSGDINPLMRSISDPTKLEVIPEAASLEAVNDAEREEEVKNRQPPVSPFTTPQAPPPAPSLQRTSSGNPFKAPVNPLYEEALLSGANPADVFDQDGCSALVVPQSILSPRTPVKQLGAPLDYQQLQLYASEPLPMIHTHHSRHPSSASTASDLSFGTPAEPGVSDGYLERAGLVLPKPEPPPHIDVLVRSFSDYTQDIVMPTPRERCKPMRSGRLAKAHTIDHPARPSFPREVDSFGREVAW